MKTKKVGSGWNIGKKIGQNYKRLLVLAVLLTIPILTQGCHPVVGQAVVGLLDRGQHGIIIEEDGPRVSGIHEPIERLVIAAPQDNLNNGSLVGTLLREEIRGAGVPLDLAFSEGSVIAIANQPTPHKLIWSSGQLGQKTRDSGATVTAAYFEMHVIKGPNEVWGQRYSMKIKNVGAMDAYKAAVARAMKDFLVDCGNNCRKITPKKIAALLP
jgi:hypothetical protein